VEGWKTNIHKKVQWGGKGMIGGLKKNGNLFQFGVGTFVASLGEKECVLQREDRRGLSIGGQKAKGGEKSRSSEQELAKRAEGNKWHSNNQENESGNPIPFRGKEVYLNTKESMAGDDI